jgi:predicted TIM-barrel fold metal-dependent hydrolase
MAHFGNPWIIDAAVVALKNKNVYVDVSGYFVPGAPIPQKDIDFFIQDLTYEEEKELVFWKNAKEIFNLKI